ncbi:MULTISPECIES: endonuclease V [Methanobacterium]|uniref:endonuclease V n=1 Tax=Methanobacterium TaxID=2160 RepID=UPI00257F429B|nr:endonuclease V [Methanobacterium sp.]
MCFGNLTPQLASIQYSLADKVTESDDFRRLERVGGVDISFSVDNKAVAAAVVLELKGLEVIETKTLETELFFPYIPGFLSIREVEPSLSVLNTLKHDFDVLMVNGHGIMHPRGFGLASHVGVLRDCPTIGVAKRLIDERYINVATQRHHAEDQFLISKNGRVIGAFFRGKYVSVGHRISLKTALNVVERTSIFKTPEPIRQAHLLATETFKNILEERG